MDSEISAACLVHDFASEYMRVHQLESVAADASFRSYWRVYDRASQSYIVMYSPKHLVDMQPFIRVAQWLDEVGVPVPKIIYQGESDSLLLIEDLGEMSLFVFLNQTESIMTLQKPIEALVYMSMLDRPDFLPVFDRKTYIDEMQLFDEWCLSRESFVANPGDLEGLYGVLAGSALDQEQGFVHRDYHSMNIYFCPEKRFGLGIIDFQDALWGSKVYDLVSLIFDRYISWSQDSINTLIESYRLSICSKESKIEFRRQVLWMGLQRNIRILGVFYRLSHRDSKHLYMNYVPRKASYCQRIVEMYDELRPLGQGLLESIQAIPWKY